MLTAELEIFTDAPASGSSVALLRIWTNIIFFGWLVQYGVVVVNVLVVVVVVVVVFVVVVVVVIVVVVFSGSCCCGCCCCCCGWYQFHAKGNIKSAGVTIIYVTTHLRIKRTFLVLILGHCHLIVTIQCHGYFNLTICIREFVANYFICFCRVFRIWLHNNIYSGSSYWLSSEIIYNRYSSSGSFTGLRNDSVVVIRVYRISNVGTANFLKLDGKFVFTIFTLGTHTIHCYIFLPGNISTMSY